MKLDRSTARALVDASIMPLDVYIEMFGSTEERNAGQADGLHITRIHPTEPARREREVEPSFGLSFRPPEPAVVRFHCH